METEMDKITGETETTTRPGFEMMRFGKLSEMDRSFDIEYWQRQGDSAIFNAAWELVEMYHRTQKGNPDELRLQRTIENFERQ